MGEGVGRSQELTMAATLAMAALALPALLPAMVGTLATLLRTAIVEMGDGRLPDGQLLDRAGQGFGQGVAIVLPLAVAIALAAILANLAAGGFVLSSAAVRFNSSRLNPIAGLRRIMDRQALMRLGLAVAKLVLLLLIGWVTLSDSVPRVLVLGGAEASETLRVALAAIGNLSFAIVIFMGVVALADFVVQRRRAQGQLRMTRDAVRRETRESEGDPSLRVLRRRRARELAFSRMMAAVETADVVVVNPIHLAVALKYDSLTMRAPRIVAKGQHLMAGRIREVALRHRVPIVQDVPLARALYGRPLGAEVPPQLYRAVARILIVVHTARFGRRVAAARAGR